MAQDSAADARAEAFLNEGLAAAERGDWQSARRAFEKVLSIAPTVNVRINLAIAESELDLLLEAETRLLKLRLESLDAYTAAAIDAKLAELRAKIPQIQLVRDALSDEDEVRVNGELVRSPVVRLNPGANRIEVMRAGKTRFETELSLRAGTTEVVRLPGETSEVAPEESSDGDLFVGVAPRESQPRDEDSVLESEWFWAAVAVVAVAGTVTVIAIAAQPEEGELGTYDAGLTLSF